jgi:hypothetical protein
MVDVAERPAKAPRDGRAADRATLMRKVNVTR